MTDSVAAVAVERQVETLVSGKALIQSSLAEAGVHATWKAVDPLTPAPVVEHEADSAGASAEGTRGKGKKAKGKKAKGKKAKGKKAKGKKGKGGRSKGGKGRKKRYFATDAPFYTLDVAIAGADDAANGTLVQMCRDGLGGPLTVKPSYSWDVRSLNPRAGSGYCWEQVALAGEPLRSASAAGDDDDDGDGDDDDDYEDDVRWARTRCSRVVIRRHPGLELITIEPRGSLPDPSTAGVGVGDSSSAEESKSAGAGRRLLSGVPPEAVEVFIANIAVGDDTGVQAALHLRVRAPPGSAGTGTAAWGAVVEGLVAAAAAAGATCAASLGEEGGAVPPPSRGWTEVVALDLDTIAREEHDEMGLSDES